MAIKVLTVDPVVETSQYASGDLIGEKLTIAGAGRALGRGGTIVSLAVVDLAKQSSALDVVFFDTDPANTTFTDNSAFDIHDTDADTIMGVVKVAAGDYSAFNDNSAASVENIQLGYDVQTLYAAIVSRGTPTYVATGDVRLVIAFDQD